MAFRFLSGLRALDFHWGVEGFEEHDAKEACQRASLTSDRGPLWCVTGFRAGFIIFVAYASESKNEPRYTSLYSSVYPRNFVPTPAVKQNAPAL